MSKLHVMELFARAKQQKEEIDKIVKGDLGGNPSPSVEQSVAVTSSSNEDESYTVLKPLEKLEIENMERISLLLDYNQDNYTTPEYMSEMSTISILTDPIHSSPYQYRRMVGSGGQYLALARPDGLWVIDMTTGLSNDASTRSELCGNQIIDLEVKRNYVVYTDGMNVGVAKCSPGVDVTLLVNLAKIGSQDDPIVLVKFHPIMPQFFAIVQKKKGWTLFDLSRLQARVGGNSSSTTTLTDSPTEGVFPILDMSSNPVLAGKKLSPGVLAILKRGTSPEPVAKPSAVDQEEFVDFSFSEDGSLAIALLSGGTIKCWKLGHRCATVELVSKPLRFNLGGSISKGLVSMVDKNFAIFSSHELIEFNFSESNELRRIKFSTDNEIKTVTSIGDHNIYNILILEKSRNLFFNVFIDIVNKFVKSSVFDPSSTDLANVESVVSVQSVGRSNQFNTYMCGTNRENCLVWSALTIDVDELRGVENVGFYGNGDQTPRDEQEEYIRSDTSELGPDEIAPPNHLQTDMANVTEMLDAHHESFATFLSTLREDQELQLKELKTDMAQYVEKEISNAVEKLQQNHKLARRNEIAQIRSDTSRLIREKFRNAMSRTFAEIENQVMKNLNSKLDSFSEKINSASASSSSSTSLIEKIDEVTESIDRELARLKSGVSAEGPSGQPMSDIRRYINGGDHMRAIEVAVHWFKSQTSVPSEDLLAITCGAIASQLKPAEPLFDLETGCYLLLVLTEWVKACSSAHADRTVAVLRSARYVTGCLLVSPMIVSGEALELCSKSLSKSLRNVASGSVSSDRSVEDQSRELLTEIREVMMKFNLKTTPVRSRDATPRTSISPGTNILQMLQQAAATSRR